MTDEPTPPSGHPGPDPGEGEEARLRELLQAGAEGVRGDAFSAIFAVRARVRRRRIVGTALAVCLASGLTAGIGIAALPGSTHRPGTVVAGPPPHGTDGTGTPVYRLTGALVSFNGCSEYLNYMKSRALPVVGPYGLDSYSPFGPERYATDGPVAIPSAGVGVSSSGVEASPGAGGTFNGSAAPAGPSQAQGGASPASPASPASFSQTNDQVAGVDEPDTVKTNGNMVVTLTGSTLRVLDLQAHVLGSLPLAGDTAAAGDTGGGFLLAGNQAVVLSSAPPAGMGTVGGPLPYYGYSQPAPSSPTARVEVVDLSDPAHPQLIRTFLFDGGIVAARLVDGSVRLVLRSDGPRISFVTPSGDNTDAAADTAANKALISASTVDQWLPAWQVETPNGATTARQPISACSSVARPADASGLSTVTVLSLDPTAASPGPGTSVVAAGSTVYATAAHVYVAGPVASGTSPGANPYAGAMPSGCCTVMPPRQATTSIYDFGIPASGPPLFDGSGSVPGWLINSYAMDEDAQGRLRVASTSQSSDGTAQSQITVLGASGGKLAPIGSVGGLGRDEFIRAVRFIGDQAYVVTFRTFDPLYVVNLADPAHPVLAGELDQPGYSEFLYPLPGQRLLGVGVQITGNEPSGLVVATYDVSNPAHPRQIDSSVLASGFQYVAQGYDPHAFLYWPPVGLALLAVPDTGPYYSSVGSGAGAAGVAAYQIGSAGQLSRVATLGHGADTATRSVVINGQVWAVTAAGVVTAELTNLPASTWHSY